MLDVTIFWDLMLKKTGVGFVVVMGVHVKLLKVFSMIHCPEVVSLKAYVVVVVGCTVNHMLKLYLGFLSTY